MYAFVDAHRAAHRGEPICEVLPIAPSSYYAHEQGEADPARRSTRQQRDEVLAAKIEAVHTATYAAYGERKVCHQLRHDGERVACCTVARLRLLAPAPDGAARLAGSTACNRPRGGWALAGAARRFTAPATTRMACVDPAVGRQEQAFVRALEARRGRGWRATRSRCTPATGWWRG